MGDTEAMQRAALLLPLFKVLEGSIAFTVACCRSQDLPIIFASSAFLKMAQYSKEEVLGRNCRLLQGPDTPRQQILEIRSALMEDRACEACILNYRKDKTSFWNQFLLQPVQDADGTTVMYLGLQADVTEELTAGSQAEEDVREAAANGSFETARMQHQQAVELLAILRTWQAPHAGLEPLHAAQSFGVNPSIPSSLMVPLLRLRHPFVLSNPRLPDGPICHASPMFLALTQYSVEQVVGRNCRFLQGPGTDPDQVLKVREAVHSPCPHAVTVRLLNYRRDGSAFWNNLHVAPIRDNEGQVAYFVGVQLDVTLAPSSAAPGDEQADVVRRHTDSEVTAGRCPDEAADSSGCLQGQPEPLLSALSAPCPLQAAQPSDKERRAQQSVVAAVRVACRSLGAKEGLRRSADFQQRASMDKPLRRVSMDAQGARRSADGAMFRLPSRFSREVITHPGR